MDIVIFDAIKKMDYSECLQNYYKPHKIIFQPEKKTTVVIWKDGSKTVVRCADNDSFNPEVGFAMALVKKILPNRSEIVKIVNESYEMAMKSRK